MGHGEQTTKTTQEIMDEFSEFPIPSYEEWRLVTEKSLKGASFDKLVTKTYEGISLQPMYQNIDILHLPHVNSLPGAVPYCRGAKAVKASTNAWEIGQEITAPTPEQFNEVARHDLEKGQTMLNIVLDEATVNGIDADKANQQMIGKDGISLSTLADFRMALQGIDLNRTPVFVDAGALSLPVLSHFLSYVREQNIPVENLQGCIGMDPLGTLAENGSLPYRLETCYNMMADIALWASEKSPSLQTVLVKGQPYHNGGASVVEELAFALATGVEYIRAFQERGLSINKAAGQFRFSFSIGSNVFMEIAKFRAARMLWSTIIDAFGGGESNQTMIIHARTSSWNKTVYDPYVNMLRTTAEAFAAAVGGVDSMHVSPFDEPIQPSTPFSRRIARNTQRILQEESHLSRTIDPAGGSWYVEALTDELAKKVWGLFQETEAKGGLLKSLQMGYPQKIIAEICTKRRKNIEHRKDIFVGINRYATATEKPFGLAKENQGSIQATRANTVKSYRSTHAHDSNSLHSFLFNEEEQLVEQTIEAVNKGATIGDIAKAIDNGKVDYNITAIRSERGAEPFESLRKATDAFVEKTGKRSKVFLANMGPIAEYKSRADFTSGFFEVGGFEVLQNNGFDSVDKAVNAVLESKADTVVICSKDENYLKVVQSLTKQLKDKQPSISIYLAGLPPEKEQALYRNAGITECVHVRSNCYELLVQLLEEKGVLQ